MQSVHRGLRYSSIRAKRVLGLAEMGGNVADNIYKRVWKERVFEKNSSREEQEHSGRWRDERQAVPKFKTQRARRDRRSTSIVHSKVPKDVSQSVNGVERNARCDDDGASRWVESGKSEEQSEGEIVETEVLDHAMIGGTVRSTVLLVEPPWTEDAEGAAKNFTHRRKNQDTSKYVEAD